MATLTRIVLFDDGGTELFSGRSVLSEPPVAPREDRDELEGPRTPRRDSTVVPLDDAPASRTHAA